MDWCLSEAGGEDEESLFEARRGEEDGSGGRQGESYRSCALSGLFIVVVNLVKGFGFLSTSGCGASLGKEGLPS